MKEKYLVILAIMVIGTAIAVGFVFWSNRNLPAETLTKKQKTENPCVGLSADQGEISCEEAVKRATTDTKGRVKNAAIGIVRYNALIAKALGKSEEQVWLIDIELEKPFTTKTGKEVKFLRVGIPLDGTNAISRSPIEL